MRANCNFAGGADCTVTSFERKGRHMEDRFGRKIEYVRVSVTDRCNLRCIYCMPKDGVASVPHGEILTFDEIERFCRAAAELGISTVKLTGGEPLVRRDLPVLVGKLKQTAGVEQVTLTTNGTLLKEQIQELAAAGLDAVNISLDTLDEDRYRQITRGGSLQRALEGIDAALACPGLPVKINCVPLKDASDEDLLQLAELSKDCSLDVRFIEMMPIGLGKLSAGRSGAAVKAALEERYGAAQPYEKRLGNGPAEYVKFPGFRGRIGFIRAVSHKFCCTCNRIRLTPEGMLKPCLQYGGGTDIKALLRGGAPDAQIAGAIREAVMNKPACHRFGEAGAGQAENGPAYGGCAENIKLEEKEMNRIGG